ncbi:MAG: hypothetical protein ACTSRA_00050 [Promethearchaeota archaeon]|nr:MAG: hypothetical protein [Helarchaeota virus Nidhogg Meg22_1012]
MIEEREILNEYHGNRLVDCPEVGLTLIKRCLEDCERFCGEIDDEYLNSFIQCDE